MPDSIRKTIITNIETGLGDIRTVNGYETEIGSNVFVVLSQIDPDFNPCVVLFPLLDEAEAIMGKAKVTFPIQVEAHTSFSTTDTPWQIAEDMLADIIKRLTHRVNKISTLTDSIVYTGGGVETYPEPGETSIAVRATFNVVYKFIAGDPFSQA